MLFNSYEFIFGYLPLVLLGFGILARCLPVACVGWLAVASVFFYGWWSTEMLWLLGLSILSNFVGGQAIAEMRRKKRAAHAITTLVVGANLAVLAYFKYADFFIGSMNQLGASLSLLHVALPMGISFFTFTQIAYVVDVYKGNEPERGFFNYVLFVTWFPHLVAGPVLHHQQMMPQFQAMKKHRLSVQALSIGLSVFAIGMFKKVVIADNLAIYANPLFDTVAKGASPMLIEAWVGVLAYALQLYFDFSGYSDMAIGLSCMFGVKLPLNFDSPYKARSIIDFWRRWHMTLSSFLRDYLYIPLGGNRHGEARRHLNLLTTMVLGGLWHGASWNFVVWGALHGAFLVVNNVWRSVTKGSRFAAHPGLAVLFPVLTFLAVLMAWVPFRSVDFSQSLVIWAGMLGINGVALPERFQPFFAPELASHLHFQAINIGRDLYLNEAVRLLGLALFVVWGLPNAQQWLSRFSPALGHASEAKQSWLAWRPDRRHAFVLGLLLAVSVLSLKKNSPFLYFQF